MKNLFIPVKIRLDIPQSKILEISRKLPKNIIIAYSMQYKEIAQEIKEVLSKTKKIISIIQVLGCSKPKIKGNTQAILLLSSGKFHAISLAYETKTPVYLLENNFNLNKISKKEIEIFEKKQKGSYIKFLNSKKVGILISTKPGQENLKEAIDLQKKLKDKKSYLFISNDLNINEFENFYLNSWINTACPRLDMLDTSIINISNLSNRKHCF
jgi:2-(3-amino-3-carboxypropyl)histidine synthase